MKERFLNVGKIFLMVLGILFLIQFFLIIGAIMGLVSFANYGFKMPKNNEIKEINPIAEYVDKYKQENGYYPSDISEVKLNKKYDYKYELSKDKNCYTVTLKSKKDATVKQYQQCSTQDENSSSHSEVYMYHN